MDRPTQFFRSFRTLVLFGAVAGPMLPWPGLTPCAVANEIQVGADTSLNGVVWLRTTPNGASPLPSTPVPLFFHALADVNGDGLADLIYTTESSTNVYVQYSTRSSSGDPVTFGAPVVVASDASNIVKLCTNLGCPTFAQAWINAIGDVNGDGRPDILFGDGTVALGNGSGFWPKTPWGGDTSLNGVVWLRTTPNGASPLPSTPVPLFFHALADVNGDGLADLIYTTESSTNVYVQYSNGTSFGAPVVVASDASNIVKLCTNLGCPTFAQAWINAIGDVNGDGRPDILFGDGTVALGNGSGFWPKTPWGGDTSLNGVVWLRPTPNGTSPLPSKPVPLFFHALADVNGDGLADLIYTTESSTNVYVQYSTRSSSGDPVTFGAPVVVASDASNIVKLCTNLGCPTFAQAWINAIGDVNGDGQKDLLFANGSVTTVLRPTSVLPTYLIGSVIYVPPGGSGQGSKITYATGAVTGSTITTKDSWSASSTTSGGVSIFGNSADISFGATFSSSDSTSVDMLETTQIIDPYSQQPPSDLINHDWDVIQLYFGVVVNGTRDYQGNISASLDFSQMLAQEFSVDGYFVQVGCFRPGSSIYTLQFCMDYQNLFLDTGPLKANKFQLTLDDLPNIVRADPYADPATAPSTPDAVPGRYVLLTNFPYSPNPNSPAMWPVTNSSTTTNTKTTGVTYTVGLKFTNVTDPTGLFTGKLTVDNKFTWGHESTTSNKIGITSGSTLTLAAPNNQVSPTGVINIYMDTVYKRFMFWIPTN